MTRRWSWQRVCLLIGIILIGLAPIVAGYLDTRREIQQQREHIERTTSAAFDAMCAKAAESLKQLVDE